MKLFKSLQVAYRASVLLTQYVESIQKLAWNEFLCPKQWLTSFFSNRQRPDLPVYWKTFLCNTLAEPIVSAEGASLPDYSTELKSMEDVVKSVIEELGSLASCRSSWFVRKSDRLLVCKAISRWVAGNFVALSLDTATCLQRLSNRKQA